MSEKLNKKIAHLVCVFFPYNSGISTAAKKQAQIGANNGYNISVYTPNYQKNGVFREEIDGLDINRIKPFFSIGKAGFINIKKYIKNIDILHIHYPFYFSVESAIFYAKKYNKKIVTFWHMNPKSSRLKGLVFKCYEKIVLPWVLKKSDKILVATSDYFLNSKFKNLFLKHKNKIEELPFSVDTNYFYPQEKNAELIKKYNLENKKVLIFVGGLDTNHDFKGVDVLLSAMAKLNNDYKLLIIGDGNLKENYKKLSKNLNIEDKIIFAGNVNLENLPKYYNLSDALILPSINQGEAFGIVQIEAASCAKPVIVSNLPGIRVVLENEKTGFVFEIQNENDLADKINKLFENEANYKQMCSAARQRILDNFSDEVVAQKLINIYNKLT